MPKTPRPAPEHGRPVDSNSRATVSGPADTPSFAHSSDDLTAKLAATNELAAMMPANANKPAEYDPATALDPPAGRAFVPDDPIVGSSTVQESQGSDKVGSGSPVVGVNKTNAPLDRVRADSTGRMLTTNQGVPVADNQNSLKAGLRGPTLLEDFILREKITHFDHERIPERIVHARGSAAHGVFECYAPLTEFTRAHLFSEAGLQTPVFVRFSTVLGERGSTDTARDVRGFAVKFYTQQGNWDLVGNNMPVFFIQDAMKFPDLVHAAKPEPHFAMPQAASAHDTFWDFASLMPEITHMLMWAMSDRAIPRSYRTMQGFGVHTFRLVNAAGVSHFVKFHWTPTAGTHSLVWDEAVKISGADPDFHRRDLWEAIEAGAFPEWELGLQIFTEEQAEAFTFDVLDATKIVPEELVPIRPVGRMVLNRNPDNFFAETEQVAFCTAHVVPGIDFSNDPLLAGRIHSYVDTQISRLGGPNFHEIPINAPVAQVHNNQRDGLHRQTINRGRVSYEPNSLAGGCPFQAGASAGFVSFPEPMAQDAHKVRGKPEKFADHYTQARLFFHSQSPVEQQHIVNAFRFELSRVQVPAIRERMVAGLRHVDNALALAVAAGLGMKALPAPLPKVLEKDPTPEVTQSKALSLLARPGDGSVRARRVALLVADGADGASLMAVARELLAQGAVPRWVGSRLGTVETTTGTLEVDVTMEAMPSVLFDAVVVPDGEAAVAALAEDGRALEFVKDQYRHCKPLLVFGAGSNLLTKAGIPTTLSDGAADTGLLMAGAGEADAASTAFLAALAAHRHFARETDPPRV
ncbi:catalase HPII [Luteitalea sp. TBR-22]|uniref:catalase n=1 Tax=Luteitalea sp. TBR-22 TaxID=2802971 RepID=UPI00272E72F0|nr:catalase [Luteitalea sp. TBR-22]BCS30985.2 catalase HPII [Luteitalea sp. TBR-22]